MNKNIESIYPLSPMQQGMLFHTLYAPDSGVYFEQLSCTLYGNLNVTAFERAWQRVVERHPVLRSLFVWERRKKPLQVVRKWVNLPWEQHDWRDLTPTEQQERLEAFLQADREQGFELDQAPLMRCALIQLAENTYQFVWSHHHLLVDGWCLSIIFKEVFTFYKAFKQGQDLYLKSPPPYRDYIVWQQQQDLSQAEAFWRQALQGFSAPTPLVVDRAVDSLSNRKEIYDEQHLQLSVAVTAALKSLARQHHLTLNTVVQGAWAVLLSRYSGEEDVVFGSTVSGRPTALPGVESMVGLFINTLPVRVQVSGEVSLLQLLLQLQAQQMEREQYSYSPLVEIQGWSDVPRGLPLFESLVVFENYPVDASLQDPSGSFEISNVRFVERTNYPLTVEAAPGSELSLGMSYDSCRFDAATISRMLGHFQTILEAIVANPQQHLKELPLLTAAERHQLLVEWNDTQIDYAQDRCIHQLFEAQVQRTPDAVAVVFENEQLTYWELNARANQVAHHLQALGVGPGVLVGICVERSLEMVVGLLGILKAGGAYVPLDPTYPQDRLAFMLEDSQVRVLLTQKRLVEDLPQGRTIKVCLDSDWEANAYDTAKPNALESKENPASEVTADDLAYIIYTSGSTGNPKGVMVEHSQVSNFFMAMDTSIGSDSIGTWLAVTTISFDISVLELLWTLTRGFRVIVQAEQDKFFSTFEPNTNLANKNIEFSLFYFASDSHRDVAENKYKLLLEGAKFADRHNFSAVWTPERHFHTFGGLYPNPSVTGAAIATITERIQIRAGSVVLPLHDPIRIAEEWAVVDNLSNGRVGISFASGWQANDFVLAPENYANRKAIMLRGIETIRQLWRGESVELKNGSGDDIKVRILPHPIQRKLPIWITAAGNPETFRLAGEFGANVLTHLLDQSIEHLAEKIAIYRNAWSERGHSPGSGHVTLMLHTFIGKDIDAVREKVRQPFCNYLRSSLDLLRNMAQSLGQDIDSEDFSEDDMDALVSHSFDRYFETSGLFGTPSTCLQMIDRLKAIGVDEVACLIDFGVDFDSVVSSLHYLDKVRERSQTKLDLGDRDYSVPAQIKKHHVSHMQCTPSLARMLLAYPEARNTLQSLQKLILGGDTLPLSLAKQLREVVSEEIRNMYGPTETTIWSTTYVVSNLGETVPIGTPIANTQIYILDRHLQPVPIGVPGELHISGAGVVRGYLNRPELTAAKFIPNPYSDVPGARLYKTGDLARYLLDGNIEFLGRIDNQVKLHGFRIEQGEIEVVLAQHPAVRETLVIVREDQPGDKRLVAYVVPNQEQVPTPRELRRFLKEKLPDYMVPNSCVMLEALPLTPNGKVDRRTLPPPDKIHRSLEEGLVAPRTPTEEVLVAIWADLLGLEQVGIYDNFFELGGNSLLVTQVISRLREAFQVELPLRSLFEEPTVAGLAERIETICWAEQEQQAPPSAATINDREEGEI